eukprot:COSAG01_NODE_48390_length_381_cov_4.769504_2_plen_28_part_01
MQECLTAPTMTVAMRAVTPLSAGTRKNP